MKKQEKNKNINNEKIENSLKTEKHTYCSTKKQQSVNQQLCWWSLQQSLCLKLYFQAHSSRISE